MNATPCAFLLLAVGLTGCAQPVPPAAAPQSDPQRIRGYVDAIPAETEAAHAERHRRVAARRAGTPVLVHRGASRFAPENTLEAFAAAMDHGADGVEIDIRRSADGVLYLHHDDELGRVVQGTGPVAGRTYFELLQQPLARVHGSADADTRIPTLAALLVVARQRAMLLHLDVKEKDIEADVIAMLDAADVWEHVVHVNDFPETQQLRAHPRRYRQLGYKGWLHEAGSTPEQQQSFVARPGRMVFVGEDPAPALRLLGREVRVEPVPLPDGIRVDWTAAGPVNAR